MNTPDIEPQVLPSLKFSVRMVPAHMVNRFSSYALPYIKRALEKSGEGFDAEDILQYCITGQLTLWLVAENNRVLGAATTEVMRYPSQNYCRVTTIAGSKFSEWIDDFHATIEPWAKAQGCTELYCFVRKGFVPKLVQYGYKARCVVVTKQLE